MFTTNIWSHDPYRQHSKHSFFSLHTYTPPHISPYTDPHAFQPRKDSHRHAAKYVPAHRRRSAFDISASELSEHSDFDMDTDSTANDRLHIPHRRHRFPEIEPDFDVASHFTRTQVRLPRKTAHELRSSDEILILPPCLTHLKVSLFAQHSSRKMRVAVAGDMRLRDVIKQLLPQEYLRDTRVYVKARDEWVEPGAQTKVGDVRDLGQFVMNERNEIEVRVIVGNNDAGRERGRVGENVHMRVSEGLGKHGWERERAGMERMRVF